MKGCFKNLKDKVAIIGVGCTRFGERFDLGINELIVQAAYEAYKDAGIEQDALDAVWASNQYYFNGISGGTVADALKIYDIPISRNENYCASGMTAFMNACNAVAAGASEMALAIGFEKLLDQGGHGLPGFRTMGHPVLPIPSAPAIFALAAQRAFKKWGWKKEDIARVPIKNHFNGIKHPKAHFRFPVTLDQVMNSRMIASPLGIFDCCAISDGAAALIITTPEIAETYKNHANDYVVLKGNAMALSANTPWYDPTYEYLGATSVQQAAKALYNEIGITNPRKEINFAEVHDCFSITEFLDVSDLQFSPPGKANEDYASGRYNHDGEQPINISGGLKCFGHPIGATGLRMLYEVTKQLQNRADGYQVKNNPQLGMAHNLGGQYTVGSISVLGKPK